MTAREIVQALGGHWHGGYGTARCPAHDDRTPSMTLRDGEQELLVTCFAGCERPAILRALRARGLLPEPERQHNGRQARPRPAPIPKAPREPSGDELRRQACALIIWREARPAQGTPVETYLRARGITIPVPPTLRYHLGLKHGDTGLHLPCMVVAVQAPGRRVTAIQRTYLRTDGQGQAGVSRPKMALGPLGAGAVRLGPAGPVLGLAEGVETALSAMQLHDVTCWAALGSRLAQVELPPEVHEVRLFADNGDPGHRAAEQASKVFTAQGRRVVLRFPPAKHGDWNNVLCARVAA